MSRAKFKRRVFGEQDVVDIHALPDARLSAAMRLDNKCQQVTHRVKRGAVPWAEQAKIGIDSEGIRTCRQPVTRRGIIPRFLLPGVCSTMRELWMILFVTCSTLGSQLLIKSAVTKIAARTPAPVGVDWLVAVILSPKVWLAVAAQGVGFLVWIAVVSRMKLGAAFATSGALFYLLLALASWAIYDERLTTGQWLGIGLVSAGVLMISFFGRGA